MTSSLRVLLLSPLPGLDPPGGDVTYTEQLLAEPPPGVEYETYEEALKAGKIIERGRRHTLSSTSVRGLPKELTVVAREKTVNSFRRKGLLFREPFRFFEVRSAEYDLVHVHVFSVTLGAASLPLVVSNGADLPSHYLDARRWGRRRVGVASALDSFLARAEGVVHNSLGPSRADQLVCFSQHLADWYCSRSKLREDQISVIPCATEVADARKPLERHPQTVGFVAADFTMKGGGTLLAAWDEVRGMRPDVTLQVVGSPCPYSDDFLARRAITWRGRVERRILFDQVFPSFDVFAYPSNWDGAPLVIEEALAHGVPVVTSDYGALPEMIGYGTAGEVVPRRDPRLLAAAILRLLEPEYNKKASLAAQEIFRQRYERTVVHRRLREVYDRAVERRQLRAS